jgi:osmoprotectant transport system ATP-binding protein
MSIKLEKVSYSFDSIKAVDNVSLLIEDAKTTVLIGPSGCGKSTLIRLITALLTQQSGKIFFDDKNLYSNNLLELRRRIGYVIQEGGLFPHLTCYQNVSLLAKYVGWENQKISDRINQLSSLTKFPSERLKNFSSEISGGQRQRVSIMRALMLDPEFLLLDEPLGALDPMIRFDLQQDLKEIFQKLKKTVLLVTHDLNEAVFFADKIVLMKDGNIVQEGTLKNFSQNPSNEFVTKFIQSQRSFLNV